MIWVIKSSLKIVWTTNNFFSKRKNLWHIFFKIPKNLIASEFFFAEAAVFSLLGRKVGEAQVPPPPPAKNLLILHHLGKFPPVDSH